MQYDILRRISLLSSDGGFIKLPRYRTFRLLAAAQALRLVKFRLPILCSPCIEFRLIQPNVYV